MAILNSHFHCTKVLLGFNNPICGRNKDGLSPIHIASLKGEYRTVLEIVEKGICNILVLTNDGRNVLHCSAESGNEELVQYLLSNDSLNVNHVDESGRPPLFHSIMSSVSKSFLSHPKVDISIKDNDGNSAFHIASWIGNLDALITITQSFKIDINDTNFKKQTALHIASDNNQLDVVRFLLSLPDIDPNAKAEYGKTALHNASIKGSTEIVRALLNHPKTNVNIQNVWGKSPLHYATLYERTECLKALVENPNININLANNFGTSPLHYAASIGSYESSLILLDNDTVEYNKTGPKNSSPLLLAVKHDHERIVDILLEKPNVDIREKDNTHRCALDFTLFTGNHIIRRSLYSYMSEPEPIMDKGAPLPPPPPPPML